ncbi:HIT family protein [Mesoplasma tabanidae]|uniref:Histidine triad protein n=1 Tax=Mesoplasma tabanidae TaxID=219745 RepID=A0A2K8P6U9_9MOLU|nr:HIT family protein [Mesoplasma tabanidae]ATZ21463.1 histidine triad protein [Mesoplasma tabanidae]
MKDCLFCKIIKQEIPSYKIYENEYVYAFLDINPVTDGHALVIPKIHAENLTKTPDLYLSEVSKAKKVVAELLEEKLDGVKGFNYVSNQEAIAKQVVFHYHEHILPKFKEDEGFLHDKNVNLKYATLEDVFNEIAK